MQSRSSCSQPHNCLKRQYAFATTKCAYFGEENPCSAKYCLYCHVPLDMKEAERYLIDRKALDLLNDPDVQKVLEGIIKNRKKE